MINVDRADAFLVLNCFAVSCRCSKQTKQNRNTDPITLDSHVNIYESRLYVQIYTHNSYIKIFNILRIPYRYLQILKRKEKNYSIIIRIRFYPYLSYYKILFNNLIIIHIYIHTNILTHHFLEAKIHKIRRTTISLAKRAFITSTRARFLDHPRHPF